MKVIYSDSKDTMMSMKGEFSHLCYLIVIFSVNIV